MDYTIKQGDTLNKIASQYGTDANTLAQANKIQNPNLIFSGSKITIPKTITADSLTPKPQVDIPTPPLLTGNAPTPNFAQNYFDNNTDPFSLPAPGSDTPDLAYADETRRLMAELYPKLAGQGQALSSELENQGYNKKRQEYQTINSLIGVKQQELAQDDVQLVASMKGTEKRDTLRPFALSEQRKLAGDAQIIRALKTSEIGVLNAQALAKQGDIALAMEFAQNAVDTKYAPYKEQIEIYKNQLEALSPILTRQEKALEAKQKFKIDQAIKEIDKVSDFQKNALNNAISNNAPQSVISGIMSAKTIEDITRNGSKYIMSIEDKIKNKQLSDLYTAKANTPTGLTKAMDADPDFKKIKGNAELKSALTAYQSAIESSGAKRKDTVGGGKLDTLYQDVLQAYRAAKDLGALQGADLQLVDDAIKRATFEKSDIGKVLNVGLFGIPTAIKKNKTEGIANASVSTAFDTINRNMERLSGIITSKNPSWVDTDYFKTLTEQSPDSVTSSILKTQAVDDFRASGISDNDIINYFASIDPINGDDMLTLFNEGYSIEDILDNYK